MLRLFSRLRVRRLFGVFFLSSLILCLWVGQILPQTNQVVVAQTVNPNQQVQQGVELYRTGDYKGAIADWKSALQEFEQTNNLSNQAIVRGNLARAYQQIGQSQQAISEWAQVVQLYRQLGNQSQVARALTEQAQIYSRIGQHRKAITLLCNAGEGGKCSAGSALQIALKSKDAIAKVAALGTLGNAYRLVGEYTLAEKNLQLSLKAAEELKTPVYKMSALNSLGVLFTSQAQVNYRKADIAKQSGDPDNEADGFQKQGTKFDERAISDLQGSLKLAKEQNNIQEQVRSLLALIPAYTRTGARPQAQTNWQEAKELLEKLPDSRDRVFATINLAQLLETTPGQRCLSTNQLDQAATLLKQAVAVAERIEDSRAESFALGELGRVYECQGNFAKALETTQQARFAADQRLEAKDSLYLWEWQMGRILKQQWEITGKSNAATLNAAISSYEQAISTLESIRGDILTASRDIQFDFRDTIDPIYRELVELKLSRETPVQTATKQNSDNGNQKGFRSILRTIDNLKLAELQNYFGNDCVVAVVNQESIDLGAKTAAAVFNTIILDNQTAVIVSLPNGQQLFNWINIPRQQLIDQINAFRIGLEDARLNYDPKPAQQVYNWIVRPFEAELKEVNTLVFVQDGIFRTVPMAALHDGNQFLIQRYAIATTPSLTLTDPKPLQRKNLRVLALGLTKAANVDGKQFAPLPNVARELTSIGEIVPGSKKLLDDDFTRDRLRQELSTTVYPILHVATHGKFATDPGDTFIVTGDEKKLTFNELDRLIRTVSRNTEPLELLFLTACETAAGNDRSALGLAGIAVQAGARSAIATLWAVNDAATARLATEFYSQLQQSQLTKAQALQAVQKAFLEGAIAVEGVNATHPAYWAPFVVVGNWL